MPHLIAESLDDFQTDIVYTATDEYLNLLNSPNLYWPRFVDLRSGGKRKLTVEWNWATANLHNLGPLGADTKNDPIVPQRQEMLNEYFGTGLQFSVREWEDDEIDRAAQWSAEVGSLMAYAPQAFFDALVNNGKSTTGSVFFKKPVTTWEGKPLFAIDHKTSENNTEPFSNLHEGMPFTEQNLARAIAYIEGLRNSGGLTNFNRPRQIIVGSNYRLRTGQIVGAEFFTDTLRATAATAAAGSNMFSTEVFDFDVPVVSPTIDSTSDGGTWYLAVPLNGRAFSGPVRLWEREAFTIRSFNANNSWDLQQQQRLVWRVQGRWGASYGDPMQIHRFETNGVTPSYLSSIVL